MHSNLTPQQADFLYNLYLIMREAPLSKHGRYRTFETAAVDLCPWHIDAISIAALEHLVTSRKAKGLKRGHRMARKERGEQLFREGAPTMIKDAMLTFFFDNDRVTMITGEENALDGISHWSKQIAVPNERLKGGSYSPYATKDDIAWAEDALAEHRRAQQLDAA